MVHLDVLRYDPQVDGEPHFQRYEVPCKEEWVVLDALNAIKESIDPTLNYRWSCHMAVCGSCGMMINREPRLACKSFLRDYQGVIRVEPTSSGTGSYQECRNILLSDKASADPIPALGLPDPNDDTINARIRELSRARPLAEVRADFDTTYQDVLRFMAAVPAETLTAKYGWISASTDDHYAEHAAMLQDIQKQSKGKCVWLDLEREAAGGG